MDSPVCRIEKDLSKIQQEQKKWSYNNFGDQSAAHSFLGMVEELGELAHSILKYEQGIRDRGNNIVFQAKARDAIGDLVIFLMGYCNKMGWDLIEIINEVWEEVQKRDWLKFPKNGIFE